MRTDPPRDGALTRRDLIQENHSFDHYFGTYRGVRGFADPAAPALHDGGLEMPTLSAWRRSVTGDLTTAFNFARPDPSAPPPPQPSLIDTRVLLSSCMNSAPLGLLTDTTNSLTNLESTLVARYPVPPPPQAQPGQESRRALKPSGPVACPRP